MIVKLLARAILPLSAVVLAACADAPRLERPRVVVDSVRLERMTGAEASIVVTLNLANPNAREIAVDAIDASVTVEDMPIGSATLKAPVRLPANGEATATLQVRAGLAVVMQLAAEIARRAQAQNGSGEATRVRYAVSGTATLEVGPPLPFSRSGDFRIGAPAQ